MTFENPLQEIIDEIAYAADQQAADIDLDTIGGHARLEQKARLYAEALARANQQRAAIAGHLATTQPASLAQVHWGDVQ